MNSDFEKSFLRLREAREAHKKVFGVFGSPIAHSLSPTMHNEAFRLNGIHAIYLPFHVKREELGEGLRIVKEADISGLNITLPHKSAVTEYLDDMTGEAKAIGSVNTITIKDGTLKGYNTDITGFIAPLKESVEAIKYEDVVVFGGGGAARMVLFALLHHYTFPKIALFTRNPQQGNQLLDEAEYWKQHGTMLEWVNFNDTKTAAEYIWESRLIVNCTPLGMSGYPEEFPISLARFFRPGQIVYDLVYNPFRTSFITAGEQRGAVVIHGLSMFIQQGAEAFRLWTGTDMPVKHVSAVIKKRLGVQ